MEDWGELMAVDFQKHLEIQLQFIETSCDAYDAGHVYEGVRIATALRVLFNQTKSQTPLLVHLGSPNIHLLSTCEVPLHGQRFLPAMTNLEIHPISKHFAYIHKLRVDYERPVTFNNWWFNEIVYLSKDHNLELTRQDLVLGAADKDGGAHVDKKLEPRYETVLQGLGWSMTVRPDGEPPQEISCKNGHLSALRQMGYEVLHSPDLLSLA